MSNLLKERRNEVGKDLKEIAEVTRIKGGYLKSIEENEFEKLPVEVYTRGYIKEYAQFLGVPSNLALEPYEEYLKEKRGGKEKETICEIMPPALSKEVVETHDAFNNDAGIEDMDALPLSGVKCIPPQNNFLSSKIYWAIPVIAVLAGIYFFMSSPKSTPPSAPPKQQEVPAVQPPPAATPAVTETPQVPVVAPPRTPDLSAGARNTQTPEVNKTRDKAPVPGDSDKETKDKKAENTVAPKKKHTLRIDATGKVWIRVVIDGKENKETLLRQGDVVSYGANESIALTVGNAAGAKVRFDGKSFDNLGAEGQVVRFAFPGGQAQPSEPVTAPPDAQDEPER